MWKLTINNLTDKEIYDLLKLVHEANEKKKTGVAPEPPWELLTRKIFSITPEDSR